MKLELALVVDDGMTGVGSPGESDDRGSAAGKVVDDFPLAFISPLASDYRIGRHDLPRRQKESTPVTTGRKPLAV